ncbi:two component transcriptional regulator, LytTR family [Salegentibacter holothuriorum]|uniref:Two component transcriptional regulator, LytTR family n=1 Tax=Salegentibacter holothuriorum TaxID=241145 RepID=A0A1T5DKA1_9FLAO|nr:LytTR family DNA-binding domain-containing protein [Salegentibacter holothuriorum]SKB71940.1 two component transcriptional regulator, LytTR family [Salegentibacter holothuriorum]
MKALVVDDEELARRRVLNLLAEVQEIEILGECSNGKSAIAKINRLQPELVFLDINMKDMNGFEVLQELQVKPKPVVVFVTAYDNYATKAFDVDAFDFLLKPFRDERFFKTIKKVLNISKNEAQDNFEKRLQTLFEVYSKDQESANIPLKLPVRQGNKTILLRPEEIGYICASGYYAEIFSKGNKYVLRESLNNLNDFLKDYTFFRIHRSVIVNLNHIKEIVHSDFSEVDVRMKDDKLLRISKSHKKELFEKLGI